MQERKIELIKDLKASKYDDLADVIHVLNDKSTVEQKAWMIGLRVNRLLGWTPENLADILEILGHNEVRVLLKEYAEALDDQITYYSGAHNGPLPTKKFEDAVMRLSAKENNV